MPLTISKLYANEFVWNMNKSYKRYSRKGTFKLGGKQERDDEEEVQDELRKAFNLCDTDKSGEGFCMFCFLHLSYVLCMYCGVPSCS